MSSSSISRGRPERGRLRKPQYDAAHSLIHHLRTSRALGAQELLLREYYGKPLYDADAEVLDPRHSALIVVDLQNDMAHPDGVFGPNPIAQLVPRAATFVEEARSRDVLIIWLKNTVLPGGLSDSAAWLSFRARHGFANPDFTVKETWGHDLMDPLRAVPGDIVVEKHRSSGFFGTDLDTVLRANRIETVAVCGCMTEGCVESTVRDAAFRDYYPVVIEDMVASNTPSLHEASLSVMHSQFLSRSAQEVLAAWSEGLA